jgi:hypothetical protein
LRDMQAELIDVIAPQGLTVVAVHSDGIIEAVDRNFTGETSIEPGLDKLAQPGFGQIGALSTSP